MLSQQFFSRKCSSPLGKMVIHLSIADLILATQEIIVEEMNYKYDLSNSFNRFLYNLASSSGIFANCGSMMWTCCFAHCLYTLGKEGSEDLSISKYKTYFFISYGVAFLVGIVTIILLLFWDIAEFVISTIFPIFPMFTIFRIMDTFLGSLICLQTVFSLIVSLNYYIRGLILARDRGNRIPWILLLYPIILLVCNLPNNVTACGIQIFSSNVSTPIWDYISAVWVLQGFFNALVYGLTSGIGEAIKKQFCQKKSEDSVSVGDIETVHHHPPNDYNSPRFSTCPVTY